MTTYKVTVGGNVRMTFSANFAQASSPILMDGDATPFQVADARHRPREAASVLNVWCRNQGGEAWGDGEKFEVTETC